MRVYRVVGETNDYQSFVADDPAIWKTDVLWLDGTSRAKQWVPPKVYVEHPRLKVPDIWTLSGCAALVFAPAVAQQLDPILWFAGELLPMPFADDTFLLLNILQDVNCLDHELTRWVGEEQGQRWAPKEYAFHPHRIPESTLFKIPETDRAEVLCVEGIKDGQDEFKALVEDENLTGLSFELLWEGE